MLYYEAPFRVELLEKAKSLNPNGLLVCSSCGWSWLTMDDAAIDIYASGTGVECMDRFACARRLGMRMKVFEPSKRSSPGRFYDFLSGRRASPLCRFDSIGPDGIIRGKECYCHLPPKVNA